MRSSEVVAHMQHNVSRLVDGVMNGAGVAAVVGGKVITRGVDAAGVVAGTVAGSVVRATGKTVRSYFHTLFGKK